MASYSWIAVKGRPKDEVFAELEVEPTGGPEAGEKLSWGETAKGWLVVRSMGTKFATSDRLQLVSRGAEAVGFWGTTVSMGAQARYFRDGQELWTVDYDCEKDPPVTWTGEPPGLADILESARQADGPGTGDLIYDVPADVAFGMCGHNEENEWLDRYGLRKVGGQGERRGFFARLFGR